MQGFWKIWMLVWCWGVLLFGVVLALAAVPGANGAMGFILATMGSDPALASLMDQPAMQFAVGLQGALTIGWALTVLGVVRFGGGGNAQLWLSVTIAVLAWSVIDSVISIMTGFALNAVSNTLLTAGYLVPVLCSGALRLRAPAEGTA